MHDQTALRKAAILLAALDPQSSDGLLRQMEPEQAQRLRLAVSALGAVDPSERQQVIDEFVGAGGVAPLAGNADPGVELDAGLRSRLNTAPPAAAAIAPRPAPKPASTARPTSAANEAAAALRFLQHTEVDELVQALRDEHPQAIALVVSHLSAEQAAAVLAELSGPVQSEVMRRMLDLDEAHPEVLHEVGRGLQARLAQQARRPSRRHAGVSVLAGILDSADERSRGQILANLERHDRQLATLLARPAQPQLEDLEDLDDQDLVQVLRAADAQVGVLALAGSSPALVDRLLRRFPPAAALALRQALKHLGPTPLSDLDQARRELLLLARRMQAAGQLHTQPRPLLNAAA